MNIFIKFFIFSTLIEGLYSSMEVIIGVDLNQLKSASRKLIEKNGDFRVKIGKWSGARWEWEYEREISIKYFVPLIVPKHWEALFNNRNVDEPFVLALKIVDNNLIEPIPFILFKNHQEIMLHLTEEKNGNIVGSIYGQGQDEEEIMAFMEKIVEEKDKKIAEQFNNSLLKDGGFKEYGGTDNQAAQIFQHQHHLQPHSIHHQQHPSFAQGHQSDLDSTNEHLQNVQNSHGNFPLQRDGKRAMSEIERGDEPRPAGNHPQNKQKLLQSSMNALHSWQKVRQHFVEDARKHGKEVEIDTDSHLKKKPKLTVNIPIPPHLQEQEHLGHGNLATATGGNFLNDVFGTFADEYGGMPSGLANQFNPSGFTHHHGNNPIGGWQTTNLQQNLPFQSNILEQIGHDNLQPIQTPKKLSSSVNAIGQQQHHGNGKASDTVAAPSTGSDYKAIDNDGEENELVKMFTFDQQYQTID